MKTLNVLCLVAAMTVPAAPAAHTLIVPGVAWAVPISAAAFVMALAALIAALVR